MTRLGGCVTTLAPQAQEILVLRAGLGTGSYSRLQVARLLDTTVPHERALEQRAAAELRRTAARQGCGAAAPLGAAMMIPTIVSAGLHQALEPLAGNPSSSPALSPATTLASPATALAGPAAALAGPVASSRGPAPGAAARRSRPASRPHHSLTRHASSPGRSTPKLSDSGSSSPSLLLIGLAVVGAGILLTPLARKVIPHAWPGATQSGAVVASRAFAAPAGTTEGFPATSVLAGAATASVGGAALGGDRARDAEDELAASSRADQHGDPEGAFAVGCLLVERGDVDGALAAYRRAAERGHPSGASNLGVLLEQQGDVDGALDAYRTAAERGDPQGAFNLGGLLAEQGDLPGALAAYGRAEERGDVEVAAAARSAIDGLHGHGGSP